MIDAAGDGIDVNGSIEMTKGVVIINSPLSNMDSALDYDRSFKITGGLMVAAGSSGMAQAPDMSSTQYSVSINFRTALSSGTLVHIQTDEGEGILSFAPTKTYQSIVFSSPELKKGSAYDVYYGGISTGTEKDGLYGDGIYTPGTQYTSFTISGIVTNNKCKITEESPQMQFPESR